MSKSLFRITSLFLLVISLSFTTHKYYLSLTQIEFVSEKKSVQVIINVFMDDIELALNDINKIDLKLTTEQELKNNDPYFKNYLQENLKFKINNTEKDFEYLGKEYDGDLVFFYLEISNIQSIEKLELKNTILVGHFDDQQNLIKTKINGSNKSKLLTKKTDKALLNF